MKKILIKYSIEFFVIVISISVSFFVENIREDLEKDSRRVVVLSNLLNELESNKSYVDFHKKVFSENLQILGLYLKDSLTVDLIKNINQNSFSPANAFFTAGGFNPSVSIYNSMLNDGSLNLIKSSDIKSRIDKLYVETYNSISNSKRVEEISAVRADNLFVDDYSNLYVRNFWLNFNDDELMQDFLNAIKKNIRFKALMMQKASMLEAKLRNVNKYIEQRDSLIIEINKSLQ